MGFRVGALVLVLDALKGALPVIAAQRAGLDDWGQAAAALGAVLGHCFSPWLGFRGGKGVVPALGSLAGAVAIAAVCVAREPDAIALLSLVCATLILVRHRGNLARLRER